MPGNWIAKVKPGDTIRATWLSDLARTINDLQDRVTGLESRLNMADTSPRHQTMLNAAKSAGGGSMPTSLTWTEVAATRGSASKVITDSASDTHTIDQATKIRMTASSGGVSYSWTFNFATS